MNNELKKIARRINRDGYINNHDNDTSKEGILHKDAGAVVLLAKDSIGLWFGGNSCINSCFIGNDGHVHLSTYTVGGTVYRGSIVPTQEDIDAYNATVIDSRKIIDWIPLTYHKDKEEKKAKSNIVKISAKVEDIITVIPGYAAKEYTGHLGFPTLIIHVDYPSMVINNIKEPAHHSKYYLTPFREYAFQISETLSGDWDCGSTDVVDLHAILNCVMNYDKPYRANDSYGTKYIGNRENVTFSIMKGLILQALDKFIYRMLDHYDGYTMDFNDKDHHASRHLEGDVLDRFTKVCIAYLLIREEKENLLYEAGATFEKSLLMYLYNLPIYNSDTKQETDLKATMPEETMKAIYDLNKKMYFT